MAARLISDEEARYRKEFAQWFRTRLRDYDIGQPWIAEKLNVSRNTVGAWATGKRMPNGYQVYALRIIFKRSRLGGCK